MQVRLDRTTGVVLRDQIVFGLVDEADARTNARRHLPFDVDRRIVRVRRRDVWIELNVAGERRPCRRADLFTDLIVLVVIDTAHARKALRNLSVVPGVGDALVVLVRVGVGADARTRVVPEQSVARLDHRLAVVGEIVGQADARADVVPGDRSHARRTSAAGR